MGRTFASVVLSKRLPLLLQHEYPFETFIIITNNKWATGVTAHDISLYSFGIHEGRAPWMLLRYPLVTRLSMYEASGALLAGPVTSATLQFVGWAVLSQPRDWRTSRVRMSGGNRRLATGKWLTRSAEKAPCRKHGNSQSRRRAHA